MLPAIALLLAAAVTPAWQEESGLPPGILLLSRIKRHVRQQVERLPDYTCLQTSVRYHGRGKGPVDVLMLEVLNAGTKELYGSPGARDFSSENPSAFTAGGLTGTGTFGLHLRTLFVNDNAMFTWRGEEEVAGRPAVRYDYRVPPLVSGFTIQRTYARAVVGMKGSFWADRKTLDLLWIEVEADEIPERLDLLSATQRVEYEPMRIGDRDVVLPQSAELRMVDAGGAESRNLIEFTHCRSFTAETKIRFDEPAPPAENAAAKQAAERGAIPAGLMVTIALATPLRGQEPVGSLLEGRVAAAVRQKGKVVIPEGAVVRGRLRRMEAQDGYFMVGLEFDEIAIDGSPVRFYGNVQDVDKPARFALKGLVSVGPRRQLREEDVYAGYVPGVALFLVPGKELNLERGFKTVWRTGSPR